ncbi:hypothetical protein CS542_02925 [Pedobacter sp. IW39]|nr:hypothetical protein CS542_02925 [Pedobacter sp. IW39]
MLSKIAKWFFTKLESEKTSHYIFVLSVVFFSLLFSTACCIEPIIGAFVAGLAFKQADSAFLYSDEQLSLWVRFVYSFS